MVNFFFAIIVLSKIRKVENKMKKHKRSCERNKVIAILLVAAMSMSMTGCGITVEKTEPENTKTEQQEVVDKQEKIPSVIRPQDDFFGAINKDTLEGYSPTYKDVGAGVAYDMQEQVDGETLAMIEKIVDSKEELEKGSCEDIVKRAYEQTLQYMHDYKSKAPEVFEENRKAIQNAKDIDELLKVMEQLIKEQGLRLYFIPSVDYNYHTGDSYALYFDQMETVAGIALQDVFEKDEDQEALHGFAKRLLMDLGEDKKSAGEKADEYIYLVLDIAACTDFKLQDSANPFLAYEYKTNAECDKLLGDIKTSDIEALYGIDNPYGGWCVKDEKQLEMLGARFTDAHLDALKTFLLCEIAMEYKSFLADEYSVLSTYSAKDMANKELNAMAYVNTILPDPVSELYEKYYFTEQMQEDFQKMFEDITASYEELITNASWLSKETRAGLLKKLHNIVFVPGGARKTDKNEVVIGKDIFDTYCNAKKSELNRGKRMLGKPIDKHVSVMNANIINAGYNPINTFTVTVAIAHAPYYDENASYSENLGGLGMVMGHEIGHGFDSMSMVWDENGKYNPDWISKEDQKELEKQIQQFEEYYSSYKILEVYSVDGKKTSGENFADLGAMECVSNIVKTKEEKKQLFENYARIWCQLTVDTDAVEALEMDEHSPAVVRVNGVLSSLDDFYDVYDVKEGDGMYKAIDERVRRWK